MTPEIKLNALTEARDFLVQEYHAEVNFSRSSNNGQIPEDFSLQYPTYDDIVSLYERICTIIE
jgi:hypothetical protein